MTKQKVSERPKRRKEPVVETPKAYEIPGLPISDGPQTAKRLLTDTSQPVLVVLPAGVFQYVWEMLESRARADHQKYPTLPAVQSVAELSVAAFRTASISAVRREAKVKLVKRRR